MLKIFLDHYNRATLNYVEAMKSEKDKTKLAFLEGKYEALKALANDVQALPEATTTKPSPQPRKPPRTIFGSMLGQRARMVMEDAMDAAEAEGVDGK